MKANKEVSNDLLLISLLQQVTQDYHLEPGKPFDFRIPFPAPDFQEGWLKKLTLFFYFKNL